MIFQCDLQIFAIFLSGQAIPTHKVVFTIIITKGIVESIEDDNFLGVLFIN
jgi:hypothetical protein